MADGTNGQHFIPIRRRDLIELCASDGDFADVDAAHFSDLCRILSAVFHYEYHEVLETLKDAFAPFSTDRDTHIVRDLSADERAKAQDQLLADLRGLLDAANYEEVSEDDLAVAMQSASLLEVRLEVDFDDFAAVQLFSRGAKPRTETVRKLGGLIRRDIDFVNYDRVLIYVHFKERDYFVGEGRKPDSLPFVPGSTILKLFQDVPRPDLEMLFPNTQVRMRPIDKVIIGVPAVISGVVVIATKLLASIGVLFVLFGVFLGLSDATVEVNQAQLVGLGAGLLSIGAFLVKQMTKFKNRKVRFMKTLADSLYFRNLDNDSGVFHHLLDQAEEEETKEAILGYWWLLTRGPRSDAVLDRELEAWLADHSGTTPDFEVDDAVLKLVRMGLVEGDASERRAVGLEEAKAAIDRRWDDLFNFSSATRR